GTPSRTGGSRWSGFQCATGTSGLPWPAPRLLVVRSLKLGFKSSTNKVVLRRDGKLIVLAEFRAKPMGGRYMIEGLKNASASKRNDLLNAQSDQTVESVALAGAHAIQHSPSGIASEVERASKKMKSPFSGPQTKTFDDTSR